MARPRKEDVDEITAVNQDIEVQKEKLRKLQEKQKRLQEADNIKLGKLVKSVFGDRLPLAQDERKIFFTNLAKLSEQAYSGGTESVVETKPEIVSEESVSSAQAQSGVVTQQPFTGVQGSE